MKIKILLLLYLTLLIQVSFANTTICVKIEERSISKDSGTPPPGQGTQIKTNARSELEQRKSIAYLQRLLEHFISHEKGYVSDNKDCPESINVEMYPLQGSWTVFARYSKNGREERVDRLFPTEFTQYAERVILALLYDVPISTTINRENVLTNDSKKSIQRIDGSKHVIFGLGTDLRAGFFNQLDGSDGVSEKLQIFHPMKGFIGFRSRYESWGLEFIANLGLGTSQTSTKKNLDGGHIDYALDAGASLHFLRYSNPRALSSFYYGAGSTVNIYRFSVIKPGGNSQRSNLITGGLDIDVTAGWEFMRASEIQFFLQADVKIPTYTIRTENDYGSINTWMPGIGIKIGALL